MLMSIKDKLKSKGDTSMSLHSYTDRHCTKNEAFD